MAKLIYSAIASLDGYVADEQGDFSWSAPDLEVHSFVNDLERPVGTYLYGRRMYEVMKVWDGDEVLEVTSPADAACLRDYAEIWRAADKIVYSRSLTEATTSRTELKRSFDPQDVRGMKEASDRDISIGGPDLASQAIKAGLVEEIHLFLVPVAVGSGKPALSVENHLALRRVDSRSFGNGTVYLRYDLHL